MRTTFVGSNLVALGFALSLGAVTLAGGCRSEDNGNPDLSAGDMSIDDMPANFDFTVRPDDMPFDLPPSPPDLLNVDLYSPLFKPAVDYKIGQGPVYVASGDFNKDGLRDLAVVVANDPTNILGGGAIPSAAQILLGVGDGSFQTPITYNIPNLPGGVRVLDVDGDTKLDLVIVTQAGGVGFMKGMGNGTFAAAVSYAAGTTPTALAIGDIDGDGKVDAITANSNNGKVNILRGVGDGSFTAAVEFGVKGGLEDRYPLDIAVLDLNNDAKAEIVTVNLKADFVAGSVSILTNTSVVGSVSFGTPVEMDTADGPNAVLLAQLDGTNKPDIVVSNSNAMAISVFLSNASTSNSTISFATPVTYPIGASPNALAFGDIDADGRTDIITANVEATMSVLHGLPAAGTFGLLESYATHGDSAAIAVGTFNSDVKLDVVTANQTTDDISVLINER